MYKADIRFQSVAGQTVYIYLVYISTDPWFQPITVNGLTWTEINKCSALPAIGFMYQIVMDLIMNPIGRGICLTSRPEHAFHLGALVQAKWTPWTMSPSQGISQLQCLIWSLLSNMERTKWWPKYIFLIFPSYDQPRCVPVYILNTRPNNQPKYF